MADLPLHVLGVDFNQKKETLACRGKTDKNGIANCRLLKCPSIDDEVITFQLEFQRKDSYRGPWGQELPVKNCKFVKANPIALNFRHESYVRISQATWDVYNTNLFDSTNANIKAFETVTISSNNVGNSLLKTYSYSQRLDMVDHDLTSFVSNARELSALYLMAARNVSDTSMRFEASRRAKQWSAYAVVGVNVGLKRIADRAGITAELPEPVVVSPKTKDVKSNAAKIKTAIGGTGVPQAFNFTDNAETLAKSNRFGNKEFSVWSKAMVGKIQ